jgi:hypothetical protein
MSFIGKYSSFAESGAIFRRKRCCFYRETMCVLGGKVRGFAFFDTENRQTGNSKFNDLKKLIN